MEQWNGLWNGLWNGRSKLENARFVIPIYLLGYKRLSAILMCCAGIAKVLTSPQKVSFKAATSLAQVQASGECSQPPPSFSWLCGTKWELG